MHDFGIGAAGALAAANGCGTRFFSFPRVVAAMTADGGGQLLAKDRVYLGYQERAGVIEVISYNEAAARFEFQLVRNYRSASQARDGLREPRGLHCMPSEPRPRFLSATMGRNQCEPAHCGSTGFGKRPDTRADVWSDHSARR